MTVTAPFPALRIAAEGLAVARGGRDLASGLTFAVAGGEALLLRGPNGAGKSSLLAVLGGALRPGAGTVAIEGLPEDLPAIHWVSHLTALKARLSVGENLRFWADTLGGERSRMSAALETVGLGHATELEAGHLSAGQSRRLALARLLVADRPVWLLDEPTSALDAAGRALVGRLIGGHLAAGGIAIAATHEDLDLPPAARVATLTLGAMP